MMKPQSSESDADASPTLQRLRLRELRLELDVHHEPAGIVRIAFGIEMRVGGIPRCWIRIRCPDNGRCTDNTRRICIAMVVDFFRSNVRLGVSSWLDLHILPSRHRNFKILS